MRWSIGAVENMAHRVAGSQNGRFSEPSGRSGGVLSLQGRGYGMLQARAVDLMELVAVLLRQRNAWAHVRSAAGIAVVVLLAVGCGGTDQASDATDRHPDPGPLTDADTATDSGAGDTGLPDTSIGNGLELLDPCTEYAGSDFMRCTDDRAMVVACDLVDGEYLWVADDARDAGANLPGCAGREKAMARVGGLGVAVRPWARPAARGTTSSCARWTTPRAHRRGRARHPNGGQYGVRVRLRGCDGVLRLRIQIGVITLRIRETLASGEAEPTGGHGVSARKHSTTLAGQIPSSWSDPCRRRGRSAGVVASVRRSSWPVSRR